MGAGLLTAGIFASVLMGLKYLMTPFLTPGRAANGSLDDAFLFVGWSLVIMALVAVAKWAEERKFVKAAVDSIYERALAADPRNAAANTALGRVLYKDEWMTPEQKTEREKLDEEADMAGKGLVRFEDQWVTPQDKQKLEQGLRKHDGRWMTPDEIKEAEGFVKHEGKWVRKAELEALKVLGPARKDTGLGDQMVVAQTEGRVVQNSVGYCCRGDGAKLLSEVIRVRGSRIDLQVFEETRGLK